MAKNNGYDYSFRCPRCDGFLYTAEKYDCPLRLDKTKNGKVRGNYFSKMFVCFNCGRIWYYEGNELYLYPQRTSAKEFFKNKLNHLTNKKIVTNSGK